MCVRKCKDFNYDVAHSDRLCKCACYMKVSKEKFTLSPVTNGTMWSIGAPTTTIFVTPKLPPTYEDEITSGPEDYDDKSEGDGDDKSDGENESEDHAAVQSGDGGDLKKSGAKETSGSNPEGDGLITIADGEDSKGDGDFEGGGDGTTAESGGEPTAEDWGEGYQDKPAEWGSLWRLDLFLLLSSKIGFKKLPIL